MKKIIRFLPETILLIFGSLFIIALVREFSIIPSLYRCIIDFFIEKQVTFLGLEFSGWLSILIGTIVASAATLYLIKLFTPNIKVGIPEIEIKNIKETPIIIKIPVLNDSRYYDAVNLRIEAAAVNAKFTYHLKFDRLEFVLLPKFSKSKNGQVPYERKFHAIDVEDYTKNYLSNMNDFINILKDTNSILRVRVHAYHELSGFGKAFEEKFIYKDNQFIKIV